VAKAPGREGSLNWKAGGHRLDGLKAKED